MKEGWYREIDTIDLAKKGALSQFSKGGWLKNTFGNLEVQEVIKSHD